MKLYSCDSNCPCEYHSDLFKEQDSEQVHSYHDKPDRKYPQWSQSRQQRKADNEEEDLLKEWMN